VATVQEGACRIDDFELPAVVRPESAAEICELVRRATAEGQALYPLGGRTMLDLGLPPTRPGYGVDLRSLNRVIDYPARDMTITVQAGITLAELQRVLAAEHQRLPVDVSAGGQATVGGALATNMSGPRRYGFGTLRDYVIGISTVNDEGHEVKAGGRVVKNVAGYDLCKLHVGALGTLGIITQVTLKVRPVPEVQVLVTLGCEPDALGPLLDQLHGSRTRPVCLDLLNGPAARILARETGVGLPDAPWVVVVVYEESNESVSWQVQQLIRELPAASIRGLEARAGVAADSLWRALAEFTGREARLSFKANLLPTGVAEFCESVVRVGAASEEFLVHGQAGSGIVRGHLNGDLTLERVREMLEGFNDRAQAAKGNVILPRCPPGWKHSLPVWGRPRNDLWLMRQVKEKLDPRRLFNPGRFVDGI
jgi:glycolate oxidase FAD binding subunit